MQKDDLLHLVPADAWEKNWNVNSQPVGNGDRSIRYLASYVFRTAIRFTSGLLEHRIESTVKGDSILEVKPSSILL